MTTALPDRRDPRARSEARAGIALRLLTVAGLAAASVDCYHASPPEFDESGASGDAGGAPTSVELPCEAASALSKCWGCHVDPPRNGAPMPLVTLEDLRAPSPIDAAATFADRALVRMRDTDRPMPPLGHTPPTSEEIDAFASWIEAGMPEGTCGEAGSPPDAGPSEPAPTTCTSGMWWPQDLGDDPDDYDIDEGSPNMNPGMACRACHEEENDDDLYFFMGTVFPTLHEEDRCFSDVPDGTRVEILDANGEVALSLPVRRRGNFFSSSRSAGIELPFTARVVLADGRTRSMSTPQMSGDCNGCHTEQGVNGAPGRILLPD